MNTMFMFDSTSDGNKKHALVLIYGSRTFLGACLILFFYCMSIVPAYSADREVVLRLKWFHQFQFAGYYAAEKKGFYRDVGLDVKILPRDIKSTPVDEVVSGSADFGVADSSLVLRKLNGDDVVVLASIFQSSPLILMSLSENGLVSPLDFVGKRVMYQRDVDDALIAAVFNELGVSDKDYQYIPHNFDDDALLKGYTDVMSAYITDQPFLYESRGYKVNIVNPINYGVEFYGDMLFTSARLVEREPEVVLAFRRASIKGWAYALDHIEEVVDWILTDYKSVKSREALIYEANATRRVVRPQLINIGNINMGRFHRISDIYKEKGLAPALSTLDGFNYQEYFKKKSPLVYYLGGAIVAILVAGMILLVVLILNQRLRQAVVQRTEELSRVNNRLRRLMGFVSHDLRNPLGVILTTSKRLRSKNTDVDRVVEMTDMIHSSAEQALELVQQVLDTAALGSGKLVLQWKSVNIVELIRASIENYCLLSEKRCIQIQYSQDDAIYVNADDHRISQVLNNIILNAVKYAPDNTVIIISSLVTAEDVTVRCVNEIHDNIDSEGDQGIYKSIGFGMEIVTEILELHQSKAIFEQSDNTFSVEFVLSLQP